MLQIFFLILLKEKHPVNTRFNRIYTEMTKETLASQSKGKHQIIRSRYLTRVEEFNYAQQSNLHIISIMLCHQIAAFVRVQS